MLISFVYNYVNIIKILKQKEAKFYKNFKLHIKQTSFLFILVKLHTSLETFYDAEV